MEHALLFDSQTLLLRNNINDFWGYDFVAPPTCGQSAPSAAGVSLRSVRSMIALNTRPAEASTNYSNSEHYSTFMAMAGSNLFSLAPPSEASLFCLERPCSPTHFPADLDFNFANGFPLAMHKTWHLRGANIDTRNLQVLLQYSICSLT